jgi:hypothetical protein
MTHRSFWVLADGRSIDTTHRDILRIYTTINEGKGYEFESKVSKLKQVIQFTEGICIREELTRFQMLRTLSDNNPTMDLAIHDGVDMSISNQSGKKGCKGIGL